METKRIQDIGRELTAAFNSHDLERAASLCSIDYEGMDVGRAASYHGPNQVRKALEDYIAAFPDISFNTKEVIADDDRLVQVWTASGTHLGRWMNIPPTGRQVMIEGISVLTVKEGKIARGLFIWDVAGLLRSIGLLPELYSVA